MEVITHATKAPVKVTGDVKNDAAGAPTVVTHATPAPVKATGGGISDYRKVPEVISHATKAPINWESHFGKSAPNTTPMSPTQGKNQVKSV